MSIRQYIFPQKLSVKTNSLVLNNIATYIDAKKTIQYIYIYIVHCSKPVGYYLFNRTQKENIFNGYSFSIRVKL